MDGGKRRIIYDDIMRGKLGYKILIIWCWQVTYIFLRNPSTLLYLTRASKTFCIALFSLDPIN